MEAEHYDKQFVWIIPGTTGVSLFPVDTRDQGFKVDGSMLYSVIICNNPSMFPSCLYIAHEFGITKGS